MTVQEKLLESGFTLDQIEEIKEGLDAGADVAIYAKKEFFAIQMRQIRLGISEGLSVQEYAKTEYDWFQMEEIRKGLKAGVDTKIYADPAIPYDKMRQLRKGLQAGINLSPYVQLDAGILRQLRKAMLSKVNIVSYIKEGYNTEQLDEIRQGLEKGLDIHPYLSKEFRGASIGEICKGLDEGIDVSVYAKKEYNWQQMYEIRQGMEKRLDISQYCSSLYSWQQMREIRLGLEAGIRIGPYRSLMYPAGEMRKIRLRIQQEEAADYAAEEAKIQKIRNIAISVSADEMEAYIQVQENLCRADIEQVLQEQGIVKGIDQEKIDSITENKSVGQFVLIASGKRPCKGKDGWYEYFFDTDIHRAPKILADGSADYHNIKWFEYIESGSKIAYYHGAEDGIDGYTVTGKVLPASKGREMSILSGKGVVLLPDQRTYVAGISGRIELHDYRIEITRLFVLDELTLVTGNLEYDGSVYVKGNIGAGAVIKATEDIVVDGFVEGAVIECGGNVLLRQGANASGNGYIRAGKSAIGKFFEAVQVYASENIQADYFLNCNLFAENMIIASGKIAAIMGGMAYAALGFRIFDAGNRAGIITHLKMGISDHMQEKQRDLDNKMKEANKELSILGNAYIDFQRKYEPEIRNSMEMYLKIESAIFTVENKLADLYEQKTKADADIMKVERACAVVKGKIHNGTSLEVDGLRWNSPGIRNISIRKNGNKISVCTN